MNDKNKRLWDNSIGNVDEEILEETTKTLYKKTFTDMDSDDFILVENEKKNKFSIFSIAASIIAIIGVVTITGVIIANTGIFTAPLNSENESSIVSEIESDEIPAGTIGEFGYSFTSAGRNEIIITSYSGNPIELVIPEEIDGHKVVALQGGVFDYCTALTTLTIPACIEELKNINFDYCKSLAQINVDSDNKNFCSVNGVLFDKDINAIIRYPLAKTDKEYIIPDSIAIIKEGAFGNCKYLTSVTIPANVGNISRSAFISCHALTSVTISEGIYGIDDNAFKNCTTLEYVNIPASIIRISPTAFELCDALTAINVDDDNEDYCSVDGVLFNETMTTLMKYPSHKKGSTYNIPDGIINIEYTAFYKCSFLTSVIFSNSVREIGNQAFQGCATLESVTMPYGVILIGDEAFSDCSMLTSVTLPESIKKIGEFAFGNCDSLETINIPESVTEMDYQTFNTCDVLKDINVDANNQDYCSVDGVLFYKNMYGLICYPEGKTETEYTIPDGVRYIVTDAFSHAHYLQSITIPDSVTLINDNAFFACKALTSVNLPNSGLSVLDSAFADCISLESVNIPHRVSYIGEKAFSNCPSLKSVYIPDFGTSIGENAFDSHVFITGAPLIKNILLIIVITLIIITAIYEIRKKRKEKLEIAEYYRRKREAKRNKDSE